VITPAQVQQSFGQHGLQLHRYAKSPELCDRRSCSGVDSTDRLVYLGAAPRTDFMVVVFPTLAQAGRFRVTSAMRAERRNNAVLVYLRAAKTRLTVVRRIFHA
jgi:uncharacterized DUF497 family protein